MDKVTAVRELTRIGIDLEEFRPERIQYTRIKTEVPDTPTLSNEKRHELIDLGYKLIATDSQVKWVLYETYHETQEERDRRVNYATAYNETQMIFANETTWEAYNFLKSLSTQQSTKE